MSSLAKAQSIFLLTILLLSIYGCAISGKLSDQEEIKVLLTEEVLSQTSFNMGLGQKWCTRSLKTVVGSGSDKCLSLSRKRNKLFLIETSYYFRGVNYKIHGHESDVDSTVEKSRVVIDGCIVRTQDETFSAAICNDQLIRNAVVPIGNNRWIFSSNYVQEIYAFDNNPLTSENGKVKITTLVRQENKIESHEIDFLTVKDRYGGVNVVFKDNRKLNHTVFFEQLYFSPETISNAVAVKEKTPILGNYHKQAP